MELRNLLPADYNYIISVVDDWWGGRDMSKILPRQFFDNFCGTSFVLEDGETIVAFIVGYHPPSRPQIGYTHFIGVHPDYRKQGLARRLYKAFAEEMGKRGATEIIGITSDINKLSQVVHRKLGFEFKPGDDIVDGVPIHRNYDGENRHRVVLSKLVSEF